MAAKQKRKSSRKNERARVRSRRELYRGPWFQVFRDHLTEPPLPGGRRTKRQVVLREYVRHAGSVVVLPVLDDGRVVLVRQYRHAVGAFLWELVAGHLDPGEKPLAAARRELTEETGYRARRLEKLAEFYSSPGIFSEKMFLYRATGLRPGAPRPEDDEALEVRAFRPAEWRRLIASGRLPDAKTLLGLLLHEARRPARGRTRR